MKRLIGRKVGMTQLIQADGQVVPVTLIEAGPCYVTQLRTMEKDGYTAVQLGFGNAKPKQLTAGEKGHLQLHKLPPLRWLREFRVDPGDLREGDVVTVSVFNVGDIVNVTGRSKGKGFQGPIKRYHFNRQPKTHGASDRTRAPGASAQTTTPGRLYKGKRMAGHMGSQRVTARNIRVMLVDVERNLLGVRGSVPGSKGELVLIHGTQ